MPRRRSKRPRPPPRRPRGASRRPRRARSGPKPPAAGTIAWRDLTVPDAERLRAFYEAVVGWRSELVDMGGYSDFNMLAPGVRDPVAGVCHARGSNADLPPQWLLYIVVRDLDKSVARCVGLGGAVVAGPKGLGAGRYCVIRDPAGAVCALYQPRAS